MKLLIALLVVSIIGNLFGLYVVYKFFKKNEFVAELQERIEHKDRAFHELNQIMPRRMVFIHHSVGRNLLKDGLREALIGQGISVHSASRESALGVDTDINHWLPKFKKDWENILSYDYFTDDHKSEVENDIIMFKSCYPNSNIINSSGSGDPYSEEKTIANYQAVFDSLKQTFSAHPNKLFVYVTSPPLNQVKTNSENAGRARQFNKWMTGDFLTAYKNETGLDNLIVFDLFDVLADENNFLKEAFVRGDADSHPNYKGNQAATKAFMVLVNENRPLFLGSAN